MYGNYGPIYTYPSMIGNTVFQPAPMFQSAPIMTAGMRQVGAMGRGPFTNAGGIGRLAGSYLGSGAKTGGILSSIKKFNWGNLLNNASKTLGVVNQAIPVVREFGPMMNNMRSMIKVASVFKDETDKSYKNEIKNTNTINQNEKTITTSNSNNNSSSSSIVENNHNDSEPNFFL